MAKRKTGLMVNGEASEIGLEVFSGNVLLVGKQYFNPYSILFYKEYLNIHEISHSKI